MSPVMGPPSPPSYSTSPNFVKTIGRAGLVAVGNSDGLLQPATHDALARAACMGVAVVRIVGGTTPLAVPGVLFIEAARQPALVVERLLADCLVRFGAPPAAANPTHPTPTETAAIRRILTRYQIAFDPARQLPSNAVLALGRVSITPTKPARSLCCRRSQLVARPVTYQFVDHHAAHAVRRFEGGDVG